MHDFGACLQVGEAAEQMLDHALSTFFFIDHATRAEQRAGIDRHLRNRISRHRESCDYKADWQAARTRHVFVETIAVDAVHKPGWACVSRATTIFYFLPQRLVLYDVLLDTIRNQLPGWQNQYRTAQARNRTYRTSGVLVPLPVFAAAARTTVYFELHNTAPASWLSVSHTIPAFAWTGGQAVQLRLPGL